MFLLRTTCFFLMLLAISTASYADIVLTNKSVFHCDKAMGCDPEKLYQPTLQVTTIDPNGQPCGPTFSKLISPNMSVTFNDRSGYCNLGIAQLLIRVKPDAQGDQIFVPPAQLAATINLNVNPDPNKRPLRYVDVTTGTDDNAPQGCGVNSQGQLICIKPGTLTAKLSN